MFKPNFAPSNIPYKTKFRQFCYLETEKRKMLTNIDIQKPNN